MGLRANIDFHTLNMHSHQYQKTKRTEPLQPNSPSITTFQLLNYARTSLCTQYFLTQNVIILSYLVKKLMYSQILTMLHSSPNKLPHAPSHKGKKERKRKEKKRKEPPPHMHKHTQKRKKPTPQHTQTYPNQNK